jgi:hypothetical protein
MYLKNERLAFLYRCIAAIATIVAIYLNSGIPKGAFNPSVFLYFTIQSNVLCLIFFVLGALRYAMQRKQRKPNHFTAQKPFWKGAAVMAITTTLLVYWLILAKVHFTMEDKPDPVANLMVHLIVPLLMIGDWALFEPKGRFTAVDPLKWAVVPLGYYGFTLIASALGARYMKGTHYPYFFMDSNILGWGQALLNIALIAVAFVALGYMLYLLDAWLGRLAARQIAHEA